MSKTKLVGEIWDFMRIRKRYWLLPLVMSLVLMGLILISVQGSTLAPFIYTLF